MKNYAVALHITSLRPNNSTQHSIELKLITAVSSAEALGKAVMAVSSDFNVGAYKVLEILAEDKNERTNKV